MRRLVKIVSKAIMNPRESISRLRGSLLTSTDLTGYIRWDVEEYFSQKVQQKKRWPLPIPILGQISEPLTVVDQKGRIILWYLPGLLSNRQQVGGPPLYLINLKFLYQEAMILGAVTIGKLLRPSVKAGILGTSYNSNWRVLARNFVKKSQGRKCEPGAVNFSAGWFAQGHTVRF